jgi:hypothetical protein
MMGMEFVLVARFETVAAPFGEEALLQSTARSATSGWRSC